LLHAFEKHQNSWTKSYMGNQCNMFINRLNSSSTHCPGCFKTCLCPTFKSIYRPSAQFWAGSADRAIEE